MHISLTAGAARKISGLLLMLTELPSTPDVVADGARHHAALIEQELPTPHHRQPWDPAGPPREAVTLDIDTATAVVELLELFEEIPSTPPAVVGDARDQSELLRQHLENVTGSPGDGA